MKKQNSLFGGKKQLEKCITKTLNIMKNEIKSEKCTRYLCAFLDENIYFKEHINNKKERPHSYAKTSEDQMKSKVFNGRNN